MAALNLCQFKNATGGAPGNPPAARAVLSLGASVSITAICTVIICGSNA